MSHYETVAKDIVPLRQKAAYGTGTLVLNLLPAALGIFAFFLITAFGMDPFVSRIVSRITEVI